MTTYCKRIHLIQMLLRLMIQMQARNVKNQMASNLKKVKILMVKFYFTDKNGDKGLNSTLLDLDHGKLDELFLIQMFLNLSNINKG